MTRATEGDSLDRAPRFLACVGIMFAWSTFSYTFFASLEGLRNTDGSATFWFYFAFVIAACVGFGVFSVLGEKAADFAWRHPGVVCAAGVLETTSFLALKHLMPAAIEILAFPLLVLASVCMCSLVVAWGGAMGSLDGREAGNIVALSFLAFGLLTAINGFLERGFMSWLAFALPAVSGGAYLAFSRLEGRSGGRAESPRVATWASLRLLDRRLVLFAMLFYVCDPVMAFLTPSQLGPFEEGTKYLVGSLGLVFALIIYLVQQRGGFRASSGALQIFVGVSFLLIFAAVVLWGASSPDIAVSCVVALRKALIAVLWIVLCSLITDLGFPAVPMFCAANLLLCAIPNLLRLGYTLIFDAFALPRAFGVDAIALACLVLVGCVAIVMLSRGRESGPVAPASDAPDARVVACERLAQKAHLTDRETEVFELLARGYTLPGVSEALSISINTVRSHSKSIYRKLGIDSKQSLIAAVESEARQLD